MVSYRCDNRVQYRTPSKKHAEKKPRLRFIGNSQNPARLSGSYRRTHPCLVTGKKAACARTPASHEASCVTLNACLLCVFLRLVLSAFRFWWFSLFGGSYHNKCVWQKCPQEREVFFSNLFCVVLLTTYIWSSIVEIKAVCFFFCFWLVEHSVVVYDPDFELCQTFSNIYLARNVADIWWGSSSANRFDCFVFYEICGRASVFCHIFCGSLPVTALRFGSCHVEDGCCAETRASTGKNVGHSVAGTPKIIPEEGLFLATFLCDSTDYIYMELYRWGKSYVFCFCLTGWKYRCCVWSRVRALLDVLEHLVGEKRCWHLVGFTIGKYIFDCFLFFWICASASVCHVFYGSLPVTARLGSCHIEDSCCAETDDLPVKLFASPSPKHQKKVIHVRCCVFVFCFRLLPVWRRQKRLFGIK